MSTNANKSTSPYDISGSSSREVSENFGVIEADEKTFEDFLTSGERIRLDFGLANGGKFAYYDGGSALMTYRQEAPDGGKEMRAAAVRSIKDLQSVLADIDFEAFGMDAGEKTS